MRKRTVINSAVKLAKVVLNQPPHFRTTGALPAARTDAERIAASALAGSGIARGDNFRSNGSRPAVL